MTFARQLKRSDTIDLSRFVGTEFAKADPCLNCSLPFECDETSKECHYVQITGRRPALEVENDIQILKDIVAILETLSVTDLSCSPAVAVSKPRRVRLFGIEPEGERTESRGGKTPDSSSVFVNKGEATDRAIHDPSAASPDATTEVCETQ